MVTDSYKKAALRLHSLGEADRCWILERLSAEQRLVLESLLSELIELGIPRAALDLQGEGYSTSEEEHDTPQLESQAFSETALTVVDTAHPSQITALFAGESDVVVATILSVRSWSWYDAVWNQLDSERRQSIEALLGSAITRLSSNLEISLLSHIADMVCDLPISDEEEILDSISVESKPLRKRSLFGKWSWQR